MDGREGSQGSYTSHKRVVWEKETTFYSCVVAGRGSTRLALGRQLHGGRNKVRVLRQQIFSNSGLSHLPQGSYLQVSLTLLRCPAITNLFSIFLDPSIPNLFGSFLYPHPSFKDAGVHQWAGYAATGRRGRPSGRSQLGWRHGLGTGCLRILFFWKFSIIWFQPSSLHWLAMS